MKTLYVLFTITIVITIESSGQTTSGGPTVDPDKIATKTIQSSSATGFVSYNSFTKLNATNDGISADANISYKVTDNFSLNLSATTPVTSKTQVVKPLTLAGISNNSSIKLGTQFISWGNGFTYDQASYNNAISAVGGSLVAFNYDNLTQQQQSTFDRLAKINWGTAYFLGMNFGFEQQDFEYVIDPISITGEEDSKTGIKGILSAGILGKAGIFALTFTSQRGYKIAAPITYYVPVAKGSNILIEKELSPSAPIKQNNNKLRLEYLSSGSALSKIRINPNINVEFNQGSCSFEVPVYILTSDSEKTNFSGGIYAGYVSDNDFKFNLDNSNLGFGVFLGASFTNLFQ